MTVVLFHPRPSLGESLRLPLWLARLSVTGALIGAFIAWALYDGVQRGFGSDVFTLMVSPSMVGIALMWAIAVAFLAGVLASIQAARGAVAVSLRAK